jgi:hypothetical protein
MRHGAAPAGEDAGEDGLVGLLGLAADELAELDALSLSPALDPDEEPHPVSSRASPPRTTAVQREVFDTFASIREHSANPCVEPPELGRGLEAARHREGVP